jgi:hypothetical protein
MLNQKIGYSKILVTDSLDERGIDVALLYTEKKGFKYLGHRSIVVSNEANLTRDILEAKFLVNKQIVYVYVNHWPSQSNPTAERVRAAELVAKEMQKIRKKEKTAEFIALGDFNVREDETPFPLAIFENGPVPLSNLHHTFMQDPSITNAKKQKMAQGTYLYKNEFNLLDRVFVSKALLAKNASTKVSVPTYNIDTTYGIKLITNWPAADYKIVWAPYRYYHNSFNGSPARILECDVAANAAPDSAQLTPQSTSFEVYFAGREKLKGCPGYSDHFPVRFTMNY